MSAVAESFVDYMQDLLHIDNKGYEHWNGAKVGFSPELRVFTQAKEEGFTAVILTFDRFEYLIKVIKRFSSTQKSEINSNLALLLHQVARKYLLSGKIRTNLGRLSMTCHEFEFRLL